MPERNDAHYLHPRIGLSLIVRPPVRDVSAMAWASGGRLIVGTRAGEGWIVHPINGTTPLWSGRAPVLAMGQRNNELVVVEADGVWRRLDLHGRELLRSTHPMAHDVSVQFDDEYVLLCGSTRADRRLKFFRGTQKTLRVLIPEHSAAVIVDGGVCIARSTTDGLEVLRVAPGARFGTAPPTGHELRSSSGQIVGLGEDEVLLWTIQGEQRVRIELTDPRCASVSGDGRFVAVGNGAGGVALVDLSRTGDEAKPATVHVSDSPVADVAFSDTGRWLASGADRLAVWSWDTASALSD